MVRKYRKKPVVIEAVYYTGINIAEVTDFMAERHIVRCQVNDPIVIATLEGDMAVLPGDWIIKGSGGEFYPCKAEIFEQVYEAVE